MEPMKAIYMKQGACGPHLAQKGFQLAHNIVIRVCNSFGPTALYSIVSIPCTRLLPIGPCRKVNWEPLINNTSFKKLWATLA